jgi:hypothetical protein
MKLRTHSRLYAFDLAIPLPSRRLCTLAGLTSITILSVFFPVSLPLPFKPFFRVVVVVFIVIRFVANESARMNE